MAFDPSRPDPALLARVPFGEVWRALPDPTERGACDPFDVRDRMALYRLLVERASPARAFGPGDATSPFWGYAAQLAWQHRSGRLAAGPRAVTEAIDAESWWGACNYALSVIPYVAAIEVGAAPTVRFDGVGDPAAGYAAAVARWRDALAAIRALRPGDDLDAVRLAVWRAHLESIELAVRRHAGAFAAMPAAERRFARGWVRMVELFGVAGWRTDLARLAVDGGGALPSRILDGDDALAALPRPERRTVRGVVALADRPAWRWRLEVAAWRRIMRGRAARAEAEVLLAGLLGRGRGAWPVRLRALRHAVRRQT